jgi:hypothetical protein
LPVRVDLDDVSVAQERDRARVDAHPRAF